MTAYQRGDRVHVTARSTDGPSGDATVTRVSTDGIGAPIVSVRLDAYVTATMGRLSGKDGADQSWHAWTVDAADVRLLDGAR